MESQQFIIMGRSIGSGPATLLASKRKAGAFILFSPLTSVKDVASKIPKIGIVAKFFISSDLFNNAHHIKNIHTPTFIVHGKKDEVVPYSHGQSLHDQSPVHRDMKHLQSVDNMTHNSFKLMEDFIGPAQAFLIKIGLAGASDTLSRIDATAFIEKYHKFNAAAVNLQLL